MWLITTDKRLINNGLTVSGNTVFTLRKYIDQNWLMYFLVGLIYMKRPKFGSSVVFLAMKKSNTQLWSLEQTTVFVHCD